MTVSVKELLARANQARSDGRPRDALEGYTQATAAAREEGLKVELIVALEGVGQLERDLGHLQAAGDSYRAALKEARAADAPLRIAHALRHLADLQRERGQIEDAQRLVAEAIGILRENPEVSALEFANGLRVKALIHETRNDFSAALEAWKEACDLYEREGIEAGVSECKTRLDALCSR